MGKRGNKAATDTGQFNEELALASLAKHGTVRKACNALGISLTTWYKYQRVWGDDFKDKVQETRLLFLDEAEDGLWDLIQERDKAAIMFTLKCLGGSRGWIERNKLDVTSAGEKVSVSFIPASADGEPDS